MRAWAGWPTTSTPAPGTSATPTCSSVTSSTSGTAWWSPAPERSVPDLCRVGAHVELAFDLRSVARHRDPSLFDLGRPELSHGFDGLARRALPPDAWVDHVPGWLSGSAELFEIVLATMGWSHHVVTMYDGRLHQPRLTAVWRGPAADHPVAGPLIEQMAAELSERYGVAFRVGRAQPLPCNGNDSVAWHGDRVARDRVACHHRHRVAR